MEELFSWIALVLSIIALSRISGIETRVQKLSKAVESAAVALGLKPELKTQSTLDSISNQTRTTNLTSGSDESAAHDTDVAKSENLNTSKNMINEDDLVIASSSSNLSANGPKSASNSSEPDPFIAWVMDNWMMKLGVGLILIGFVWALNYAYQAKYLTNTGVSVLGIIIGLTVLTYGFIRAKLYVKQGSIFMLLGTGLIMLTAYFMKIMQVVDSQLILMLIMVLSLAVTAAASVLYNTASLSIASLVLAMLVPAILSNGSNNYLNLYIYLLIVVVSTIWVVAITRWRVLTLLALIGVCIYSSSGVISGFGIYANQVLMFSFVFAVIFFLTNTVSLLRNRDLIGDTNSMDGNSSAMPDIIAAILNVAMLTTLILTTMAKDWHVLVLSLVAITFVIGAYIIYRYTRNPLPFFTYAGIAGVLVAYITFLALGDSSKALSAAYTVEVVVLSLLVYMLTRSVGHACKPLVLLSVPLALIIPSITNIIANKTTTTTINPNYDYYNPIGNSYYVSISNNLWLDYLVVVLFLMASAGTAMYYKSVKKSTDNELIMNLILLGDGLIMLALIWGVCQTLFGESMGVTASLIIYAILGVAAYAYGKNTNNEVVKVLGGALIGLTMLWLVSILAAMGPVAKVTGFIIVGGVLLSSAFMIKKKN